MTIASDYFRAAILEAVLWCTYSAEDILQFVGLNYFTDK